VVRTLRETLASTGLRKRSFVHDHSIPITFRFSVVVAVRLVVTHPHFSADLKIIGEQRVASFLHVCLLIPARIRPRAELG